MIFKNDLRSSSNENVIKENKNIKENDNTYVNKSNSNEQNEANELNELNEANNSY